MKIISIGSIHDIYNVLEIEEELELLKHQNVNIKIIRRTYSSYNFIDLYLTNENINTCLYLKTIKRIKQNLALAISDFVINTLEIKFIKAILLKNYNNFSKNEQDYLIKNTKKLISGLYESYEKNETKKKDRKHSIYVDLLNFFEDNNEIIIDGFMAFRLKDYKSEIEDYVEKIVDDFFLEQEYKEFINLLKDYVKAQEAKEDIVHVVTNNTKFDLYNAKKEKINDFFLKDFNTEITKQELNREDLLISVLITIAPNRIVFHRNNFTDFYEAINTAKKIFLDNVIICKGCKICKSDILYNK